MAFNVSSVRTGGDFSPSMADIPSGIEEEGAPTDHMLANHYKGKVEGQHGTATLQRHKVR